MKLHFTLFLFSLFFIGCNPTEPKTQYVDIVSKTDTITLPIKCHNENDTLTIIMEDDSNYCYITVHSYNNHVGLYKCSLMYQFGTNAVISDRSDILITSIENGLSGGVSFKGDTEYTIKFDNIRIE